MKASFHLNDITEIDDTTETFAFSGILVLEWKDSRQAFASSNNQSTRIYQGEYQLNELAPVWRPQVVLINATAVERQGVVLRINSDGTVTFIQTINAVAETDFSVRRYPFDRQQLEVRFQVFGFDADQVLLEAEPISTAMKLSELRIPQWTLTGIDLKADVSEARYLQTRVTASTLVLTIGTKREALFMLRLVIVPLIAIVVLSWTVFWMNLPATADRINISFVGLLTAVAYQIVVKDSLPHMSYVTLMNGFLNLSFFLMCAVILANLIIGVLHQRGEVERAVAINARCQWAFPSVYFGLLFVCLAVAFAFF